MALYIQSFDSPIMAPKPPSAPSRRRTSALVDFAFISSTFFEVTPSASAAIMPLSTQRTTSCQRSSPQRVTGPCGSFEIRSVMIRWSPGTFSLMRWPASAPTPAV